jgi:hypothetical protein
MHASDRYLKEGVTSEEVQKAMGTIGYASYLCHGVVGKGLNDYDRIFSILAESGFNGWISVEDGLNGLREIGESVLFLQRMWNKSRIERMAKIAKLARGLSAHFDGCFDQPFDVSWFRDICFHVDRLPALFLDLPLSGSFLSSAALTCSSL